MTSVDESKNDFYASERRIHQYLYLKWLQEKQRSQDPALEEKPKARTDDTPIPLSLNLGIDRQSTQVGLSAIKGSPEGRIDDTLTPPSVDLDIDRLPTQVKLSAVENRIGDGIADVPTAVHAAIASDIERLSTQVELQAAHWPSPYSLIVNGLRFDDQLTWIIPVIHAPRREKVAALPSQTSQESTSTILRLVKSSGVYALASFVSPLVSLVLAPFLTHHLSHTDYGALVLLNTVIALMGGVTQFGLNHAFFRTYNYDYEARSDQLRVVSTLVALLLLVSITTTATMILTAPWLSTLLFNIPTYAQPLRIVALVILLQNLTVPGFSWLRAESRAALFSILSILNLLVSLGTNIVLVGVMHLGITGSLLATAGGYGIVVICTLPVILLRAGLGLHRDIAWNLLSFGLPLVSNFVSVWVLQLSDRYLLSLLGSLSQTASYAVAYSLGGVIGVMVLSPFQLAWPTTMFTLAKREDAPQAFQFVFRWFSIALLVITFAFSLISTSVLFLLFPPSYHAAAPIIPIVAVSTMFYGIYVIFTTGIGVQRKNWLAVIFTACSALINVGLNFVLIPRYGSIGAALSTLVAYIMLALIAYIVNQRIYHIPYEIGMFIIALVLGVALYLGAAFLARTQGLLSMGAIYVATLTLYGLCLLMLGRPSQLIRKYWHRHALEDSLL